MNEQKLTGIITAAMGLLPKNAKQEIKTELGDLIRDAYLLGTQDGRKEAESVNNDVLEVVSKQMQKVVDEATEKAAAIARWNEKDRWVSVMRDLIEV